MNSITQSSNHRLRGEALLRNPSQNKDAAFSRAERVRRGLVGLLPSAVLTIEQQQAIELEHIFSKPDPLEQYIGLIALLDRNETLFYRVLVENLERLIPIIYTPTVGAVCERYSHIFRRPRGLFICPDDRGHIAERLDAFRERDIRLIVVTDNERILGLGDQGAGGMAIPVGKLVLYCAGAAIHPDYCLPVSLDVGTDNPALLNDPLYLGYHGKRLRGEPYESLVAEFVAAVHTRFPKAVLQWEDFKKANAFRLLERYADQLPSFNDDIQGTAAVTLAGVLAAMRLLKQSLRDQRFLLAGAGAAGVGIGRLLRIALMAEGLSEAEARARLLFVDSEGVVHEERANLENHKRAFALPRATWQSLGLGGHGKVSLDEVVRAFRATTLIGTTGQPGDFTPEVIRAMAAQCERPLIFALSNPTSKAECTPAQALEYSNGRALVATGSPFEPVIHNGRRHVIGQCNNVFIFPGIGLGALLIEARRITDGMFLAAARTLADFSLAQTEAEEALYPGLQDLRVICRLIALKVAQAAREEGVGKMMSDAQIQKQLETFCWFPDYPREEAEAPAARFNFGEARNGQAS